MTPPRKSESVVDRALLPFQYELLWHLAEACNDLGGDVSARDIFERYYQHRPSYQRWSSRKVAVVLRSLCQRGLVASSKDTDALLPGRPPRRYWLTWTGNKWLSQ